MMEMPRSAFGEGEILARSAEAKACPHCGMPVTLHMSKQDTLVDFACPPESPCRGTGLITVCLPEHLDEALEAWNRRTDPVPS